MSAPSAPNPMRGTAYVLIVLIVAVVFAIWMFRPHPRTGVVQCADVPHQLIDVTQFETQYWTYSLKLESFFVRRIVRSKSIFRDVEME